MIQIKKYTSSAYASRLLILLFDIAAAVLSVHLAGLLRFNFEFDKLAEWVGAATIIVIVVRIFTFIWFRTYAVIVRYAGAADILQVFMAVSAGSLFLFGLSIVLRPMGLTLPMSILLIDFFLLVSILAGTRLMMPGLFHILYGRKREKTNIIIIGAGQLGAMTRNMVRQDASTNYQIVGIIDDNPDVHKKFLDGIPVFPPSQLSQLVNEEQVDRAIFAIQNISLARKNELVDKCLSLGLKVLQVPFRSEWIHEDFQFDQIKEIQIEDLLNRDPIILDKEIVNNEYRDQTILITGGAGSIGSELVRQLIPFAPQRILVLDQAETPLVNLELECRESLGFSHMTAIIGDVTDTLRMTEIIRHYQPQILFHAAAYKHVPIMESYPREAIKVNINGTKGLADIANEAGIKKFVLVSTDKAVNPTNVMGASKRIAEMYIQSFNHKSKTAFITTRFGNVLGSNGSVVPRFRSQLQQGGPITVTHPDITRYFMTIPEASQLVLEAGAMGKGGEIFLFDMGMPVKIIDLAIKMIQLSGLRPFQDIDIKFTGLRPGEKLNEELLATKENSIETHHPKITKAKIRENDFEGTQAQVNTLIEMISTKDNMSLVRKMKEIVPEFISNNSVYDIIDN